MHSNSISNLLNIKGVKVKKVEYLEDSILVHIETKPSNQSCPCCKELTSKVHDYRIQRIKHFPICHRPVTLILRKRRYSCSCGKRFYEKYSFLSRYLRMTNSLIKHICHELRKQVSFSTVANDCNVTIPTAIRYFNHIQYQRPSSLPKALCIDEFRGNTGNQKFQCILVDGKRKSIIDILPDRRFDHLVKYFSSFSRHERLKVKYFISDMWKPYVEIARCYFPNAVVIADKYHFIRQVTWAIEAVRKRLQKTMPATLRKYYKHSRSLVLMRESKVKDDKRRQLDLMLTYNDDLRRAHWLKERFYDICHEKRYRIQRQDFHEWIKVAESSGLPEFKKCALTFRHWQKEILNAFKYGYTNGVTEGFNNKIKVLKRISYGMQNFERFRNRILHCN